MVPNSVLFEKNDQDRTAVVYRVVNKKIQPVKVQRGLADQTHTVVREGLQEGDVVVVQAMGTLRADQTVEAQPVTDANEWAHQHASPDGAVMDVARVSVERPVATWMRILILMLLGAIAYSQLSVELLPDVERPSLFVSTSWSGVAPEDLETQITRPVEDAVATVPGLRRLTSTTSEGNSRVTVEFHPSTDMREAALNLMQLVQSAQRSFPTQDPTLQLPTIQQFDPNSLPVLVLGVSGIAGPVKLRTTLEDEISPMSALEAKPWRCRPSMRSYCVLARL